MQQPRVACGALTFPFMRNVSTRRRKPFQAVMLPFIFSVLALLACNLRFVAAFHLLPPPPPSSSSIRWTRSRSSSVATPASIATLPAQGSSTRLASSLGSDDKTEDRSNGGDDDDDDDFMASLRNRVEQVSDGETKMPIVALDAILPRQVLKIEVTNDKTFLDLIRTLVQQENPSFGMVGMATLAKTGQTLPLQNGVQVEIIGKPQAVLEGKAAEFRESSDVVESGSSSVGGDADRARVGGDGSTDASGLRVELKATRRFRITGEFSTSPHGWSEARVKFLNSQEEEAEEERRYNSGVDVPAEDDDAPVDRMSLARAMSRSREFTSPNMNMPGGKSLVERWIELAKEREKQPGQIDQVLEDIGKIPGDDQPTERAFWVGALINPLPGLGVAMEIRPMLHMARTAEERVLVALQGILASIKHMDGSKPLF